MLAQRQRELLSSRLRQRQQQAQQAQQQQQATQQQQQAQQQRTLAMRAQGLNLPPNIAAAAAAAGLPGALGNARMPQASPQQFPYPPTPTVPLSLIVPEAPEPPAYLRLLVV